MEFEAFKNTIMDLVSKEVEDRGLEGISMKLTTVESPDGMTDRLMVSVDDSKMSMAFRLKEIYQSVEDGEDIDLFAQPVGAEIVESIDHFIEQGRIARKSDDFRKGFHGAAAGTAQQIIPVVQLRHVQSIHTRIAGQACRKQARAI